MTSLSAAITCVITALEEMKEKIDQILEQEELWHYAAALYPLAVPPSDTLASSFLERMQKDITLMRAALGALDATQKHGASGALLPASACLSVVGRSWHNIVACVKDVKAAQADLEGCPELAATSDSDSPSHLMRAFAGRAPKPSPVWRKRLLKQARRLLICWIPQSSHSNSWVGGFARLRASPFTVKLTPHTLFKPVRASLVWRHMI